MAKFKKEIMRSGSYEWGTITPGDCEDFFAGVGEVHRAGLFVPLVLEHPPELKGQLEGVPMPRRLSDPNEDWQKHVQTMRGTVGEVDYDDPRNRINEFGGVDLVFNVPDEDAAQQFRDGRIKFVSPELRPGFYDAWTKRKFGRLMTHVAATLQPKQRDQARGFVQLSSLDDAFYIPATPGDAGFTEIPTEPPTMAKTLKLSDNDPDDKEGTAKTPDAGQDKPPENPDMPAEPVKDATLEALLAHLSQIGLCLQSDTTKENLVDRLLTAAMTFNSAKDKADAENEDDVPEAREDTSSGTMQFSDGSPQALIVARIKKADKKIPKSIREMMLAKVGSLQFSEAGAEVIPAGSVGGLSEMVTVYEGLPDETIQLSENALSPQDALSARIQALADANKVTPGIADMLRGKIPALQLSENGEATGELPALVSHYEQGAAMVAHLLGDKTSGYQMSENGKVVTPTHPGGAEFLQGQDAKVIPVGDPRGKAIADDMVAVSGLGMPVKKVA